MIDNKIEPERAIAVLVIKKGSDRHLAEEHLQELTFLAETAGASVIEVFQQELIEFSSSTMIGKGKLEAIQQYVKENNIVLVLFDNDLSPAQVRNLEKELQVKVVDRSGLILDIFAKRAKSNEAKTQVELAQLQYLLPRLTGLWTHLSKQYGGIRTKGPGETQIETDRRIIRERIQKLKTKLSEIEQYQEVQRKGRESLPRFALVGYTNAGKSTLMNTLTGSGVYIENRLFATLDTTVRQFELPGSQKALLSDTVGFIRKLPAHLIASFRTTLAEAREADVLIHVVDVTSKYLGEHIEVVQDTLSEINIIEKPTILVFNKIDLLQDLEEMKAIANEFPTGLFLSAQRGINVSSLLLAMKEKYDEKSKIIELIIPYNESSQMKNIYSNAEVLEQKYIDDGVVLRLRVQSDKIEYIKRQFDGYILSSQKQEAAADL